MSSSVKAWWAWLFLGIVGCMGAVARGPGNTPHVSTETPATGTGHAQAEPPVSQVAAIAEVGGTAVRDQGVLEHLPKTDAQWEVLCARGNADVVSERLCANRNIRSLQDLQSALGLAFRSRVGNGELGNPAFALLSHSTSLTGRAVSPLNPRAFLFTNPATKGPLSGKPVPNPDFVALAFARGEPLVEVAARDRKTGVLRFFLIRFDLGCEADKSCSAWDVYGPGIESGWKGLSVYDDTDLSNTVFDCNVCHQPEGPGTTKMLRMVEQRFPWTHFFRDADEGRGLLDDYFTAHHRSEAYAGIPGALVSWSEPARLEGLVENEGFIVQPAELPTKALAQMVSTGKLLTTLPAYDALYQQAKSGAGPIIPFPYARFVDRARFQTTASQYMATLSGSGRVESAPTSELSEPRDLHTEEARWRAGLRPAPNSDGASIVVQMCARCHNGSLDQSVSRARFDATRLSELSASERALAVARMKLPRGSALKMPPERFGTLTDDEIEAAAKALGSP